MNDEQDKLVDQEEVPLSETDPWAAAFAALEQRDNGSPEPSEDEPSPDVPGEDQAGDGEQRPPEAGANEPDDGPGEPDLLHDRGIELPEIGTDDPFTTEAEIEEAVKGYQEQARSNAINSVVELFKTKGAYTQPNGKLGRSIADPDIAKTDSSGRTRYFNPETGEEFRGPNPRKDARDYVNDYNQELADNFNKACAQYEAEAMKEFTPAINTLKFAPTYEKLDPLRQGLFDDVVEDYEVRDKEGNFIGYSCDLNAALNLVNRQVKRMQSYKPEPKPATGPAMDMKKGSSKGNVEPELEPEIKSLEDAMLYYQNKKLESRKKGGK